MRPSRTTARDRGDKTTRATRPIVLEGPAAHVVPGPRGRGVDATSDMAAAESALPGASTRLLAAIGENAVGLYRLVELLGDEDLDPDTVVEWLGALAMYPGRPVPVGHERAWVLATLVSLLGARAQEHRARASAAELPRLDSPTPIPSRVFGLHAEDVRRVGGALRELDVRTRAAVVLVVHEGLSLDEAARIQGSSRRAFARRYASGLSALGDELVDVLIG